MVKLSCCLARCIEGGAPYLELPSCPASAIPEDLPSWIGQREAARPPHRPSHAGLLVPLQPGRGATRPGNGHSLHLLEIQRHNGVAGPCTHQLHLHLVWSTRAAAPWFQKCTHHAEHCGAVFQNESFYVQKLRLESQATGKGPHNPWENPRSLRRAS